MLHRQEIEVHEAVDAVGQAGLLGLVELPALDSARDALGPADLGQLVCLYCGEKQLVFPLASKIVIGEQEAGESRWEHVRAWIWERCCCLFRNWRISALSWSFSDSRLRPSRGLCDRLMVAVSSGVIRE